MGIQVDDKHKFGARLLARRQELKMSQADLAKIVGVSGCAVGSWERSVSLPFAKRVHEIANALGWSVDQLISGTELNVMVLRHEKPVPIARPDNGTAPRPFANAYLLGNGQLHGRPVKGSIDGFLALVLCDCTHDDVWLAWAEALVDTAVGFAEVNPAAALTELIKRKPEWEVRNPEWITPDL